MLVAFKVQLVIRILVDILLKVHKSGQFTNVRYAQYEMTDIGRVNISFVSAVEPVLWFTGPGKVPDPKGVISTSRHDNRTLGPFLLANISMFILDIHPFGFDNGQTAHSACMPTKYVRATPS